LDGLEAGLTDGMQLLAGGRRIDDRHRSLRSAIGWSYALLGEPGQAVLRRVSVFAGPFTPADHPAGFAVLAQAEAAPTANMTAAMAAPMPNSSFLLIVFSPLPLVG